MNSILFDKLEMAEQVPTELMTEITEKPNETILNIADHTAIKMEDHLPGPEQNTPDPFNTSFNNPAPGPVPQRMNAGNLITGQMAVSFLDMVLPILCVIIIEKINGKKVNKKSLQATAEEKKVLEPVLHNYLMSINFNVDNPLNALLITVAFIYGTKTIEVINDMPATFSQLKSATNNTGIKKETRGRKPGIPNKKKR